LRTAGLEVWFDQSELRGGDAWDASIRKQIKECSLFVPIISNNTQQREEGYFRLEWKLAVDRSHLMADNKAFFFPVILGDVAEPLALVPDKFRERQWTRLNDDAATATFGERIAKLVAGWAPSSKNAPNSTPNKDAVDTLFKATPSIAVLAFANRSASADDEYFSDGLADELLNVLSKIKGLRVVARTSSFAF
jgi:TIR domain